MLLPQYLIHQICFQKKTERKLAGAGQSDCWGLHVFAQKLTVNVTVSKLSVLSKCTAADYTFDL